MKKNIGIAAGFVGILLIVLGIVSKVKEDTAVSVIGGADGPTAIFVAGKWEDLFVGAIIIGIAVLFLMKKRH